MSATSAEPLENRILLCHGRPVLRAADLAAFYGLTPGRLLDRLQQRQPLPGEFAFFADAYEPPAYLRDGPQGEPPYVFTEHGALAAGYLLGSENSMARGLQALRAFARFRSGNTGASAPDSWPASGTSHVRTATDPTSG